jgi:hypothetical protein
MIAGKNDRTDIIYIFESISTLWISYSQSEKYMNFSYNYVFKKFNLYGS